MSAIDCAIEIAPLCPLHIIRDHQIEFAIAIIIHPRGAGRKLAWAPHSCRLGNLTERSVTVIVIEVTLAQSGDKQIIESVVVVIAHSHTQPEHWNCQARLARCISKRPVAAIVIELQCGSSGMCVSGEVGAVDQDDVRISIVVVVDECAARPHRLGQPLLSEGAVVVREPDSGLRRDVAEVKLLGLAN